MGPAPGATVRRPCQGGAQHADWPCLRQPDRLRGVAVLLSFSSGDGLPATHESAAGPTARPLLTRDEVWRIA